jgi:hypothetical protein
MNKKHKPDFFYIIKGLLFSVILTVLRKVLSFRASCSKIYEVNNSAAYEKNFRLRDKNHAPFKLNGQSRTAFGLLKAPELQRLSVTVDVGSYIAIFQNGKLLQYIQHFLLNGQLFYLISIFIYMGCFMLKPDFFYIIKGLL